MYFLIREYNYDNQEEIIRCKDEKELRNVIIDDFEEFDLYRYDSPKSDLNQYFDELKNMDLNDLKNLYLRLFYFMATIKDSFKTVTIIKGIQIDRDVKIGAAGLIEQK